MVKYFLKNTDQEVKIGNTITIKAPITTPYGEGNYEAQVLVTETSFKQLIKDKLVEAKEVKKEGEDEFNTYKPYFRRLQKELGLPMSLTIEFLDNLAGLSLTSHNVLLLKAMAEVMNRGKEMRDRVYIIAPYTLDVLTVAPKTLYLLEGAFYDKKDCERARELLRPFLEDAK